MLKRILIAATAGLFLLAGAISYAHSAECEIISEAALRESLTEQGAKSFDLTAADVARVLEQKGMPPNGDETKPYKIIYAELADVGILFFIQEGCAINKIGPAPSFMIQNLLGQVSARSPYKQSLLMRGVNYAAS